MGRVRGKYTRGQVVTAHVLGCAVPFQVHRVGWRRLHGTFPWGAEVYRFAIYADQVIGVSDRGMA